MPNRFSKRLIGHAWRPPHNVPLVWLEGDREGQSYRGDHIDPEDLRGSYRKHETQEDRRKDRQGLATVSRKHEKDGFLDVIVDGATFADGSGDRGEVVVGEDHLGGFLRDFRAFDAHGDTDVGLLERRSVIDPITGHGDHLAGGLHGANKAQLVLGTGPRKDIDAAALGLKGIVVDFLDLADR